jgi:hypothetical protein
VFREVEKFSACDFQGSQPGRVQTVTDQVEKAVASAGAPDFIGRPTISSLVGFVVQRGHVDDG